MEKHHQVAGFFIMMLNNPVFFLPPTRKQILCDEVLGKLSSRYHQLSQNHRSIIWRHANVSGSAVMSSSHRVSQLPANNTIMMLPVFTCVYLWVCVCFTLGEKPTGCRLIAEHECLWSCSSWWAGRRRTGRKVDRMRTRGSSQPYILAALIICQAFVHLLLKFTSHDQF